MNESLFLDPKNATESCVFVCLQLNAPGEAGRNCGREQAVHPSEVWRESAKKSSSRYLFTPPAGVSQFVPSLSWRASSHRSVFVGVFLVHFS